MAPQKFKNGMPKGKVKMQGAEPGERGDFTVYTAAIHPEK